MKFFSKQKNNKNRGFTLVESLVAISIFTMSILSVLNILSNGIADTGYAKKKILAGYLAQEGIEEIRNIRDTFMLYSGSGPAGWAEFKGYVMPVCTTSSGFDGCYFSDGNISFDPSTPMPVTQDTIVACYPVQKCGSYTFQNGVYGVGGSGPDSGLTPKITITNITADEVKVTSTISWTQPGSGAHSVSFSENLYNWIQ